MRTLALGTVVHALLGSMAFAAGGGAGDLAGHRHDPAAKALADSAYALRETDPSRSLVLALSAMEKARRAGDLESVHRSLEAKRSVHYLRGQHEEMFQACAEALRVSQELEDERLIGADRGWLSVALTELRQPQKAYQQARRALDHLQRSGDKPALAQGQCDLSRACLPVDKHGEAISYATQASRTYSELGDSAGVASAEHLLANVLMDQRRWNDALPVLLKAYRHFAKGGSEAQRCAVERDIAITYAGLERWSETSLFLDRAQERADRLQLVRELPLLFKVRIRSLTARGDHEAALRLSQRLIDLNDSLIGREVAGRLAALNAAHDQDTREEELEALGAANAGLKRELEQARSQSLWWAIIALAMVGIGVLALVQLRFNRRAKVLLRERDRRVRELSEEVHAQHLDLQRQHLRLTESMVNEEEKELRLKEIHHRVKNNLQVVNTLLKMQALHLNDPRIDQAFNEAQGRVLSMALVHEHIYTVGDLSRVNVKAHVMALAEGVLANHGLQNRVRFDLRVELDKADVETLIPLSLLLNELLTNAAKYAFVDRERGRIELQLRRLPDGRCELLFSDDGHGMPHERLYEGNSFGMELVRTLAAQLDGTIRLLRSEGTVFELVFKPEERRLRAAS